MRTIFRLYADNKAEAESSIFDLIDGDKETKQTKGLAYILKEYPELIKQLLNKPDINNFLSKQNSLLEWKKITLLDISAEKISSSKKRADIVIKINNDNENLLAIIIEAKSIKKSNKGLDVAAQMNGYLSNKEFPELSNYNKLPIILTKYLEIIDSKIVSITWNEILNILDEYIKKNKDSKLLLQYLKFITGVDKSMNYYEKEVLSIPAGSSINLVNKYGVYVCPDTQAYNYKKTIFVTFRNKGGGEMDKLFKIEDILVFNPRIKSELQRINDLDLSESVKKRIFGYIKEANFQNEKKDEIKNKKFYILSTEQVIDLKHKPHPKKNNAKYSYYTLSDILTKEEVMPESQL
ncbi:MAG: hypothetical protein H7A25_15775 [Leptospiraceae bacterium]|nr:hypothetical protein [Leptospiraceae bacterium]MCP5501360.1 hypothetical protein [Leptospiraceae bacterium]